MTIPNYETILNPLLSQLSDGKKYRRAELTEKLAEYFNLSSAEKNQKLPCGKESVLNNRVGWAQFHLKHAGLTETKTKGLITITEAGKKALKEGKIDKDFLKKYPKYQKYIRKRR